MYRLFPLAFCICIVFGLAQTGSLPTALPDPLVAADGTRITTVSQWRSVQRPRLLELFTREMYGVAPPRPAKLRFLVFDKGSEAPGGKAIRRQITILLKGDTTGPRFDLLLYIPKAAKGRVPAILGINFWGNQAITADPGVRITGSRVESGRNSYANLSCVQNGHATEACRGINAAMAAGNHDRPGLCGGDVLPG
jgi:hypothetical protein